VKTVAPARRRLLEGAVAAAPALAAGWVAHRGSPYLPFPPTALADRLIRLTPGDVATAAIDRFHHFAQQLLAAGVIALLVALAGLIAARVTRARVAAALWGAIAFAGGLAAPVERSFPGALAAAALAGAVFGASLHALRRRPGTAAPDPARRQAIVAVAAFTGGVLVASHPLGRAVGALIGRPRRVATGALPRAPIPARGPFPTISGLSREVTSVDDHYVVDIDINDPVVDGPSWRLEVGGLVDRPLELSFADLQRDFDLVEEISVLTCISNVVGGPLVGNSRWEGVPLRDLLARARPRANTTALAVRCADGYSAGIPLAAARHSASLVAIAQDGEALTRRHGFPCRLRIPSLYGMLNPKWVQSIQLLDRPFVGYWAQQGWSRTAVVRTESRIDTPDAAHAGQPTWIAGVAWAGIRGISRVEVSTDGGRSWGAARLRQPVSPWAWTQWAYRWTPPVPGSYAVSCRATDGAGRLQDPTSRPPHPSGASGYHQVQLSVS
jgi:DMSO/TMAO reductase YedYZ molybdopterin-dependent catalytic subunit